MTEPPKTRPQRLGARTVSTTQEATPPQVDDRPRSQPKPATAQPKTAAQPRGQSGTSSPPTSRTQRYDDLERKETRLRPDQVAELSRLARELAREARRSRPAGQPGERITDNTLIRVAVDLLLAQGDQLAGVDEQQIRRSVGL